MANSFLIFVFLLQILKMKAFLHHYRFFFGGLIVFSIITISLFYSALKPAKTLPIYNPADVNPELVDSTVQYKSKYHTIADFSFINQNGDTITQKNYEGKIYVADFFFTTCGSICPKMTTNLEEVQKAVDGEVLLTDDFLPYYQSLNPDFWQVYYQSGRYYYNQKEYGKAKAEFEKALTKEITTVPDRKNIKKYLRKIHMRN